MKLKLKNMIVLFALMLITACAQTGLQVATSNDQRLAYVYGSVTGLRASAAQAVETKAITKADGQKVLEQTDKARTLLDAAKSATDPVLQSNNIAAATIILLEVQKALQPAQGLK